MHINKKQYRKGHFGCLGGQGREEADQEPTVQSMQGAPTLSSLHPLQGVKLRALALAALGAGLQTGGQRKSSGLFSWCVFHILKEPKRNMGCLESAVISQEREKGNIQFPYRLPNPDNQRRGKRSEWVRAELLSRNKGCAFGKNGPCTIGPEHSGVQEGKKWKLLDAVRKMGRRGAEPRTWLAMRCWAKVLTSLRIRYQIYQMGNTFPPSLLQRWLQPSI